MSWRRHHCHHRWLFFPFGQKQSGSRKNQSFYFYRTLIYTTCRRCLSLSLSLLRYIITTLCTFNSITQNSTKVTSLSPTQLKLETYTHTTHKHISHVKVYSGQVKISRAKRKKSRYISLEEKLYCFIRGRSPNKLSQHDVCVERPQLRRQWFAAFIYTLGPNCVSTFERDRRTENRAADAAFLSFCRWMKGHV